MSDHYYSRQQNVESNPVFIEAYIKGHHYNFKTDTGVFSKSKIDFGSKLLIENILIPNLPGPILDVGCGYGPIGITIARENSTRTIHMIDINERALSLATENAALNDVTNVKIYESDRLTKVTEKEFAAIITNPPIRAGKTIVFDIYRQAYDLLVNDGELWVVIQKKQGAQSTLKFLKEKYNEVEVVKKAKGYFIIVARKTLTSEV